MSFQDFLERCEAQGRRYSQFLPLPEPSPPRRPLRESHIFSLGDDEKVAETTREIQGDLVGEIAEGIPMPFEDTTCISKVDGKWIADRVELQPEVRYFNLEKFSIENLVRRIRPQEFWVSRFMETADTMVRWPMLYLGMTSEHLMRMGLDSSWFARHPFFRATPYVEALNAMMDRNSAEILWDIALISHPQNYVVKVTPELSPREKRREAGGDPRPIRKKAHFIVVDHEVLVNLTRKPALGTHASPVPHYRRGHWKRLAERCRHARLHGKDRVFVRPTYVGDRIFSDEKHLYEVLLDFNQPKMEARS